MKNVPNEENPSQIDCTVKTMYNFRTVRDRRKVSTEYLYKIGVGQSIGYVKEPMTRPLAVEIRGPPLRTNRKTLITMKRLDIKT